jgi:hypothetical protein
VYIYLRILSAREKKANTTKRKRRNDFLPDAVPEVDASATPAPPATERELSLDALRALQYVVDQSRLGVDDWTNHTVIDQFQTSALRYQMYEIMYMIGIYQGIYAPNFHGYASEGVRNVIEKSMTKKVMNFWKWESLWGKFTLDWDPAIKDNIMVTGFFTQGLMLYIANTGDMRYTKPSSLTFHVDDNAVYEHDIHSMDNALVSQWNENPYCLFSCEPNWTFTPCNFQGMTGQVLYDRVFGTNHAEKILPRFRESLVADFATTGGSLIPLRSAITGFTIPGVFGSMFDLSSATMCRGYLDDIAKQMWAIFKTEVIRYDEDTGDMTLFGLAPSDKMDPGNYQSTDSAIYPYIAYTAAEYGDEKLRLAALKIIKKNIGIEVTGTGAMRLKSGSFLVNMAWLRSQLLRYEDWKNLIAKVGIYRFPDKIVDFSEYYVLTVDQGPSKTALAGPILNEVPYPGVLVAKARSHTSLDLDLVLYPSAEAGSFVLGVERLQPRTSYTYGEETVVADSEGKAKLSVHVNGRTEVRLTPISMT